MAMYGILQTPSHASAKIKGAWVSSARCVFLFDASNLVSLKLGMKSRQCFFKREILYRIW
jgi:hypothetical protein